MLIAASDYPFLDLMWSMFVFFAFVIWIWILITVFGDIFRRRDFCGWEKALGRSSYRASVYRRVGVPDRGVRRHGPPQPGR